MNISRKDFINDYFEKEEFNMVFPFFFKESQEFEIYNRVGNLI